MPMFYTNVLQTKKAFRKCISAKYSMINYLYQNCASFAMLMLNNTHTHNRFTAGLEYVRVHPGQQVPER